MSGSGDYISREAALLEIEEWADTFCECDYVWPHVIKSIRKIPAADVRPVVRANWVERKTNVGTPDVCYFSSCCGFPSWYGKLNFCPHCGADMRPEPPKGE